MTVTVSGALGRDSGRGCSETDHINVDKLQQQSYAFQTHLSPGDMGGPRYPKISGEYITTLIESALTVLAVRL